MQDIPVLQVEHASKTYGSTRVLKDVSLSFWSGKVHAIVGENGAGKSTLIKIISGVEQPDQGTRLLFDGSEIPHMTPEASTAMGIAVIYQDVSLFPNLTVYENISLGMQKGLLRNRGQMQRIAREAFEEIGIPIDIHARLSDLSIGQQQIVAIARCVVQKSRLIIMDEPTAALSLRETELLFEFIHKMTARGIGIVYISHKLDEVFALADWITVLRDGSLIVSDSANTLNEQTLITHMVGRDLDMVPFKNTEGFGEVLFEVRDLKNDFVDGVSFRVRRGEILGITGLVGAGRSEMAQSIVGLHKLREGEIYLHGQRIHIRNLRGAVSSGITYLPEDRKLQGLFPGQTMRWNATVASLKNVRRSGVPLLSRTKEDELVGRLMEMIDIRPRDPMIHIESMSGGNQQKVLLGRWLCTDPKVLIVDEPTSGVDVGARLEIYRLMRSLVARGVAVIVISSDLNEVLTVSDTILVMRSGRVVDRYLGSEATQEAILRSGMSESR